MFLNSVAYIAHKAIGLGCFRTNLQAFFRNANQLLFLRSCLSDDEHARGICIIAVHDGRHVHIDDVTVFQYIFFLGNAMTHHFIDTGTNTFREAFVIEASRNGMVFFAIFHADIINFLRMHPLVNLFGHFVQHTRVHHA